MNYPEKTSDQLAYISHDSLQKSKVHMKKMTEKVGVCSLEWHIIHSLSGEQTSVK